MDEAPEWTVVLDGVTDGDLQAVHASLLTLCDGVVGVRGDPDDQPGVERFVLVAGAFGMGPDGLVRPLPGPGITLLVTDPRPSPGRRVLDLRSGTLVHDTGPGGLRTIRFASLARPGVVVQRAECSADGIAWGAPLAAPNLTRTQAADHEWSSGEGDGMAWGETASDRAVITAVADQQTSADQGCHRLERLVAVRSGPRSQREEATATLDDARREGFDQLFEEHRETWATRWEHADIEIEGDDRSQLAIRLAMFHLLSCASTEGEAAVGARGLTGLAYAGHVFWDTEAYVLPALAAVAPDAARAVIEYRIRRLPAAKELAARRGLPGARYPWESADSGDDVTPTSMRDIEGRLVAIRTGLNAEHINADVAWAAHHYLEWTGDRGLLDDGVRDLVLETARHWQALVRRDPDGLGHLYGVTGPDEYHEVVDDNAFTNGMARWHLRWAASIALRAGRPQEAAAFEATAADLVDGFDPATRRHEQSAGFWDLEPLVIGDFAEPPVAADILLGRDRVQRSQVIKQPDVLMLHHLVPETCPPGSLSADLQVYLPLTAHGSSLSPAICAALIARDGRPDDAMPLFDLGARLDLDDLTETTAGGLHLATFGALWQAVVYGFAGVRPGPTGLHIDPHLPARWNGLRLRCRYRGVPLRIRVAHDRVDVDAPRAVPVLIDGRPLEAPVHIARHPEDRRTP